MTKCDPQLIPCYCKSKIQPHRQLNLTASWKHVNIKSILPTRLNFLLRCIISSFYPILNAQRIRFMYKDCSVYAIHLKQCDLMIRRIYSSIFLTNVFPAASGIWFSNENLIKAPIRAISIPCSQSTLRKKNARTIYQSLNNG